MQLIPAGVHAVVVALHTGLRSAQEAQSMDINKVVSSSSHSMALLGVSETEVGPLLERFNSQIVRPPRIRVKSVVRNFSNLVTRQNHRQPRHISAHPLRGL